MKPALILLLCLAPLEGRAAPPKPRRFQSRAFDAEVVRLAKTLCRKLTPAAREDRSGTRKIATCLRRETDPWVEQALRGLLRADYARFAADTDDQVPATLVLEYPDGRPRLVFEGCRTTDCGAAEGWVLVDPVKRQVDVIWADERGVWRLGPGATALRDAGVRNPTDVKLAP